MILKINQLKKEKQHKKPLSNLSYESNFKIQQKNKERQEAENFKILAQQQYEQKNEIKPTKKLDDLFGLLNVNDSFNMNNSNTNTNFASNNNTNITTAQNNKNKKQDEDDDDDDFVSAEDNTNNNMNKNNNMNMNNNMQNDESNDDENDDGKNNG